MLTSPFGQAITLPWIPPAHPPPAFPRFSVGDSHRTVSVKISCVIQWTIRVSKTEGTTDKLSEWKKWYGPHNLRSPLLFLGIFCCCSFIPPETSVPRRREKKLLLGRYSLAGAQKFAFARCCHRESDYALPNGDQVFAISTYWKGMATLDSGTVCLRLHGSSPFAVQVLFEIIKSRPTLFLLNPSCPETLSASWEKESWGSNPPWYIGQLPCEEESWGSKRPWYIWQFPWEDASCGSNPVTDTLNRF